MEFYLKSYHIFYKKRNNKEKQKYKCICECGTHVLLMGNENAAIAMAKYKLAPQKLNLNSHGLASLMLDIYSNN